MPYRTYALSVTRIIIQDCAIQRTPTKFRTRTALLLNATFRASSTYISKGNGKDDSLIPFVDSVQSRLQGGPQVSGFDAQVLLLEERRAGPNSTDWWPDVAQRAEREIIRSPGERGGMQHATPVECSFDQTWRENSGSGVLRSETQLSLGNPSMNDLPCSWRSYRNKPKRDSSGLQIYDADDPPQGDRQLRRITNHEYKVRRPQQLREQWQIQKDALLQKFGPTGWQPRKRLSPDALDGIRALHAQDPDKYTTPVLADEFQLPAEAIRRILKSKWRPNEEEEEERKRRWEKRGESIWTQKSQLGIKAPKKWRNLVSSPSRAKVESSTWGGLITKSPEVRTSRLRIPLADRIL
ncbi:MAG: hypothetical protein Q9164_004100 [Protoblastenia rupestris]